MGTELRELMIYQSPKELGALFTDVEEMTKELGKQQKVLIAKQMQDAAKKAKQKAERAEKYKFEIGLIIGFIILCIIMGIFWTWLYHDSRKRHPELWQGTYRNELEKHKRYEVNKIKDAIKLLDEQNYENNKKLITDE
jgi:hypothetical protein